MTQHELIIAYIREHGSIEPAKHYGEVYKDTMFGSESSKRARELRAHKIRSVLKYPRLSSEGHGKFERFYLTDVLTFIANFPKARKEENTSKTEVKSVSLGI